MEIDSPENLVILYNNADTGAEIEHPENAGLVQHDNGWVYEPKSEQNPPKTGDSSHLALWMMMLVLSMGCGAALLIMNLRRMNYR